MGDRRYRPLVLLFLALGLAFRLWAVPSARLTGDESDHWFKARQVAVGQQHPVYGPEITGSAAHLPGPALYYLMAVPQLLGPSPYWGSGFVVLLHLLAAALLYRLVRLAGGPRAGLIAVVLVAFAPWDVLYGDRIWASCVAPVWGAATLYAAVRAREAPMWLGPLVFLGLVLPQMHLSVPVLWAACATVLILQGPARWPRRPIVVGLALTALAYAPTLVVEVGTHFENTRRILAHGGGAAPWSEALTAPFKVFGYAVLYASSEIGYHWARGYWGGGFSEADAYFTAAGLARWWRLHGPYVSLGHAVSIGVAITGWAIAIRAAARNLAAARARRSALQPSTALTVAMLVGLAVGAVLLLVTRKTYFPHYANILMPMLLAPVAFGLDAALAGAGRWRAAGWAAIGVSAATMAVGTARYYREVDALNGLRATVSMVDRIMAAPGPVRVRFLYFANGYAWHRVAEGLHGRRLPADDRAPVTYVVDNRAPHRGPVPEGGTLHGPVLMTRRPPIGGPPGGRATAPQIEVEWRSIVVDATHPDGSQRSCTDAPCRYGDQPWQKLEPTLMTVAGRPVPLLFLHPIEGGVVRARIPVPLGVKGGILRYALSDAAVRSTNRAPVQVVLHDGTKTRVGAATADNHPGLRTLSFSIEQGPLVVELRTANEGARVFGFDVRWTPR